MIQYIATDLDGTLIPYGTTQPDDDVYDLILKLRENGVRFIAASGRQYQSMRRMFEPVKDDISYICENGSLCIHNGKTISRGLIDRELGLRIIEAGKDYGNCHLLLSCESKHYTDSKDPAFINHMKYEIRNDIEAVDDLCDIDEPFLKLAIADFNGTDRLAPFLKERFSSEIRTVTAGKIWVDFLAPGTDKGTALACLLNHLGIPAENGIAFGDQHNDIEMLKFAGTGYAMASAAPGVSDYADCVTDSVKDVMQEVLRSITTDTP